MLKATETVKVKQNLNWAICAKKMMVTGREDQVMWVRRDRELGHN